MQRGENAHKEGEVCCTEFVAHQIFLLGQYAVEYTHDAHYLLAVPFDRTRKLLVVIKREPSGLTKVWTSNREESKKEP